MASIEDYKNDLTQENSEATILSVLADAYPALDAGPGTPIYEMVVRPTATIFARQADGVVGLTEALDITDHDNIPESDLDKLLTRFFSYRREGRYVSGVVRLIFTSKVDITIHAGDLFEASNDRIYESVSDHFITSDDLQGNDTDGYNYDIAVVSVGRGSDYNADANEYISAKGSYSSYIRRSYFLNSTSDGGVSETNYTFYNRTRNELAARNLYSYRSVKALLLENFPELQEVVPIGLRDEEMMRDIVPIPKYGTVHRGGMCDIYVRPTKFTTGDGDSGGYTPPLCFPLMYDGYTLADNPDALVHKWTQDNLHVVKSTYRGSSKEEIAGLGTAHSIRCLSVNLHDYDNFIEQDKYNLLHTDNLVRAMWVMVVTAKIQIVSSNPDTDVAIVKQVVSQYVNSMSSTEYPQVAEVAHLLLNSGIQEVKLPLELRCYYLMPDLSIQYFGTGDTPIYPHDNTLLEPQEEDSLKFVISQRSELSLRTCCWYTNEDLIKVEVVS